MDSSYSLTKKNVNFTVNQFTIYVKEEPFVCEEAKGPVEANPFDDSKQVPIAILNGKVVNDDEITEMDILIDGGKIVQVGKDLELPSDTHTLDAADK